MRNFEAMRSLMRAMWLGFRRDRRALIFTVIIPLFFLVIFGGIFGHQSTGRATILEVGHVTVLDGALASPDAGQVTKVLKVVHRSDLATAISDVKKGNDDAVVSQSGNTVIVHYSQADPVTAGAVQQVMNSMIQDANLAATHTKPTFTMSTQVVEDQSLKPIQVYTPGMLGWALASAAMFGASATLVTWRTKGLLRRLRLSPAPTSNVFGARILVSLGIALVQSVIFILAGVEIFGMKLSHDWFLCFPIIICGVLSFLAIGLLIGSVASSQDSAQAMSQLVVLPMAFLGGSFVPISVLPGWLQVVSNIFPLKHLNTAMVDVMARGEGITSVLPEMGVLLGFAIVAGVIASRFFRWDQV
jgi:ABC-2 type transport system permease protein